MFIAQVLVGPSKQLKQIFQIEHNIVKNPNLQGGLGQTALVPVPAENKRSPQA